MLLVLRTSGRFVTNPPTSTPFSTRDVLIDVGTDTRVQDLHERAHA